MDFYIRERKYVDLKHFGEPSYTLASFYSVFEILPERKKTEKQKERDMMTQKTGLDDICYNHEVEVNLACRL